MSGRKRGIPETNRVCFVASELSGLPEGFYLSAAIGIAAVVNRGFEWRGTEPLRPQTLHFVRGISAWSQDSRLELGDDSRSFCFEPRVTLNASSADPSLSPCEFGAESMGLLMMTLAIAGFRRSSTELRVRGATHLDEALTFEVVASTGAFVLEQMGFRVSLRLKEVGYGGLGRGVVEAEVAPPLNAEASGIVLAEPSRLRRCEIVAACSGVPNHIHQRQATQAKTVMGGLGVPVTVQLMKLRSRLPGSVVSVTGWFGHVPVTCVALGGGGRSAEQLGELAAVRFREHVRASRVIPQTLLPFLLVPLAVCSTESQIFVPEAPYYLDGLNAMFAAFGVRRLSLERANGGFTLAVR